VKKPLPKEKIPMGSEDMLAKGRGQIKESIRRNTKIRSRKERASPLRGGSSRKGTDPEIFWKKIRMRRTRKKIRGKEPQCNKRL